MRHQMVYSVIGNQNSGLRLDIVGGEKKQIMKPKIKSSLGVLSLE
jgi:hypothetical protein